jgi:hypothetical protein
MCDNEPRRRGRPAKGAPSPTRKRYYKPRIGKPGPASQWTAAEREQFRELRVAQFLSYPEIALRLGKSEGNVMKEGKRLGFGALQNAVGSGTRKRVGSVDLRAWSDADIARARKIIEGGGSRAKVAEAFGITNDAAAGRCRRAGLFVSNLRKTNYVAPRPVAQVTASAAADDLDEPPRPPMPPGDLSWFLITAGTILEGAEYRP